MENENQIFHRNCGEILRMGLHVESALDFFISNYFCSPQSYKTFLFEDEILTNSFPFERKIQIFKKVCERESIDEIRIKEVVEAIKFVQKIRNRVAHDEAFVFDPKEGIKLNKRKSVIFKKDELKITEDLVTEIDEKRLFALQEISKIHVELSNPLREKKVVNPGL